VSTNVQPVGIPVILPIRSVTTYAIIRSPACRVPGELLLMLSITMELDEDVTDVRSPTPTNEMSASGLTRVKFITRAPDAPGRDSLDFKDVTVPGAPVKPQSAGEP